MKSTHKRIFWTVLTPPLLLLFAVLVTALTRWLDQTIGGQVVMLLILVGFCVKVGHMAWTWPGWSDDDA
jgi:hypothetical protein